MKRRPTDTSEAPARERRRPGRSLPVLAGAAIAAIGLTVISARYLSAKTSGQVPDADGDDQDADRAS